MSIQPTINPPILVDINLPNVEYGDTMETAKIRAQRPCVAVGVKPFMEPLISQLAVKHPEWRFVAEDCFVTRDDHSCQAVITTFDVYEKREKLGVIGREYSYGRQQEMYTIGNFRTDQALLRARSVKTTDIRKAIKHVEKYFKPVSPSEKISQLFEQAESALNRQLRSKHQEQAKYGRSFNSAAEHFLEMHMKMFKQSIADKETRQHVEDYFTTKNEVQILESIGNKVHSSRTTKVMQIDNTYYVVGKGGLRAQSAEGLSEDIRHKLGILKLVEDGQAVAGIGFRHNAEMFILLGDIDE